VLSCLSSDGEKIAHAVQAPLQSLFSYRPLGRSLAAAASSRFPMSALGHFLDISRRGKNDRFRAGNRISEAAARVCAAHCRRITLLRVHRVFSTRWTPIGYSENCLTALRFR
jgi:hypothetical protein